MTALETTIREIIREEIRRLIRPDALSVANDEQMEDPELRKMALEVATRFRRVRSA